MNAANQIAPARISIAGLGASDRERWDAFVRAHAQGSFFHLSGWEAVLRRAFGHQTYYLYAERDGAVEGVLPLALVRSRLFANALVSTPFGVYGGVLAASGEAQRALEDAACDLARETGVDYLEMRNRARTRTDWPARDLYVTFRRRIDPDPERNMLAIPRKQRAMVRKGQAAGLTSRHDPGVEQFYKLYSESVRNLGTPVFSRRYVEILREEFGPACEILTVSRAGQDVASVMSFFFRDEVLPYYGGGTAEARACAANDFMYWEVMRDAATRGVRIFDFGRSKRESGSYRFKLHWGFEPEALSYEYHLVRAQALPDLSPNNPRYRLLIAAWKRLPLPVSRVVGPWLARNLG